MKSIRNLSCIKIKVCQVEYRKNIHCHSPSPFYFYIEFEYNMTELDLVIDFFEWDNILNLRLDHYNDED